MHKGSTFSSCKCTMEVHFRCVFFHPSTAQRKQVSIALRQLHNGSVFSLCFCQVTRIFTMKTHFCCVTTHVQWKCCVIFLYSLTKWKHIFVVYLHNENMLSICKLFCKKNKITMEPQFQIHNEIMILLCIKFQTHNEIIILIYFGK